MIAGSGVHVSIYRRDPVRDHRALLLYPLATADSDNVSVLANNRQQVGTRSGYRAEYWRRSTKTARKPPQVESTHHSPGVRRVVRMDARAQPLRHDPRTSPCDGAQARAETRTVGTGASSERSAGRQPTEQSRAARRQPRLRRNTLSALRKASVVAAERAWRECRCFRQWGTAGRCGLR